ncbi:MAG: D-alanine--D-alanine ligase [Candidatus Omnitrophica bacterium]|nr:D-alanine--D-alanine ligase [Candidatus Omnitrophota bacterium]
MTIENKTIGVLMGGFSSEREISLKSGTAVCRALKNLYAKILVFDFKTEQELVAKLKKSKVDCMFNALHGRFGEDGQVQKILDDLNIVYTGSGSAACALAMNKVAAQQVFKQQGLIVPEYQVFNKHSVQSQGFYADFPLVVKPAMEGSSIGLSIVDDPQELFLALKQALLLDQDILIEKYISGREITIGILEDKPLPIIEVVPKNKFYDFQAKYTVGMTEYRVPAQFPRDIIEQVQGLAIKAHKALGCRCFSRVDMIIDSRNNPYILEVNAIPGLTETSLLPKAARAVGIEFADLCQIMIRSAEQAKIKDQEMFLVNE